MYSNLRILRLAVLPIVAAALGCSTTTLQPEAPSSERAESAEQSPAAEPREVGAEVALAPVYFATDESRLGPESRDALTRSAKAILAHPEWDVVTIEGHCDERGGDAYNEALGSRRAESVARFLVERDVPRSRLETRSYGSTQPSIAGHGERAWRYNRRSVLAIDDTRLSVRVPASDGSLAAR